MGTLHSSPLDDRDLIASLIRSATFEAGGNGPARLQRIWSSALDMLHPTSVALTYQLLSYY